MNWTRKRVAERWGMPFWELVAAIYEQGFNRRQAGQIVGMEPKGFRALLSQHPERNPWGSPNVVANYVRDTGEPFKDALLRMQREGYSGNAAARAIGFSGQRTASGLRYAMKVRGIEVEFKKKAAPPKLKPISRGPAVYKGWPTWGRIYEMAQSSSQGMTN